MLIHKRYYGKQWWIYMYRILDIELKTHYKNNFSHGTICIKKPFSAEVMRNLRIGSRYEL